MWNEATAQHAAFEGRCDQPCFLINTDQPRGMCSRQSLKCRNCAYQGGKFNLYDELPPTSRGPKAAAPNLAWQVALQETSIGISKSRMLLTSINVPPPSRSGMNKNAAKAAKLTVQMVQESLHEERQQLKETNKARGLPDNAPINVSIDGRYNSSVISSRNKAGQNASQAIGIAIEQQTPEKKIVAAYMQNKLCWTGSWLRNKGFNIQCPGGHEGCTATLARNEPLSEFTIGEKLGEMFANDNIPVKYVTTDGDARTAQGVEAAMKKYFQSLK